MGQGEALGAQLIGEGAGRLRGPAQRAHRAAPRLRFHQIIERLQRPGLGVEDRFAAGALCPHPVRHLQPGVDLADRALDRRAAHRRRLGHRGDPAPTNDIATLPATIRRCRSSRWGITPVTTRYASSQAFRADKQIPAPQPDQRGDQPDERGDVEALL